MPDFEGADIIELQPLDEKLPYSFKVEYCTAASANDGVIPYGYTLSSASTAITAVKYPSSTSATSALIDGSASISTSNSSYAIITIPLTWPVSSSSGVSILGPGTYHITFDCMLSGVTERHKELNFNRVFARDK